MREDWVKGRSGEVVTQLHYARRGEVTGEMARVAERERLDPELVRAEVAAGRLENDVKIGTHPFCGGSRRRRLDLGLAHAHLLNLSKSPRHKAAMIASVIWSVVAAPALMA